MENPIPTQKEALRIVREADNNYTPLKLFHQMGCPKTLELLKKLDVWYAEFLINHARSIVANTCPETLLSNMHRFDVVDTKDHEARGLFIFLGQLVEAWDKKNAV